MLPPFGFSGIAEDQEIQGALPSIFLLHSLGAVDLDMILAKVWHEFYSCPALHWAMIEALVAAVSFFAWISWFFFLNEIPRLKDYRMVMRAESHPLGTHCMTNQTKHRVWASLPVCLGLDTVLRECQSVLNRSHSKQEVTQVIIRVCSANGKHACIYT